MYKINMKTEKIDYKQIKPYWKNNKIHSKQQIDIIRKSIVDYGYIQPICIDKNNEIIIWHGRFEAIKQLIDLWSFPKDIEVVRLESLTPSQVRKLRLLDNKVSDIAERNIENIKFELDELQDIELNELFVDMEELKWADDFWDDFSLPSWDKWVIETMTFTLHKDQKQQVDQAIEISKKMWNFWDTGNENSNWNALARICVTFITQNQ